MSVLMPDIISICFTQRATVDLATALCGFMKLIIEKLDFFLSRLMFFLCSSLKLQPRVMLYLIEMNKFLTAGEIRPSPRLMQLVKLKFITFTCFYYMI